MIENTTNTRRTPMKPRQFAKLFNSVRYGQILLVAAWDEDGLPCIIISVDTHPDALDPTENHFSYNKETCQFEKLEEITQERAEELAADMYNMASRCV